MNYLEKFFDGVHYVFNLNAATLSGAIDIIVVEQEDGTLKCTPFHVRFGKLQLLNSREKVVSVSVNGKPASFEMKLGNAGEAFFVEETDEPVPSFLATSPISSPKGSRRNSRSLATAPSIAFMSTEELVPELVGPRRIITTTKTTKTTKTVPSTNPARGDASSASVTTTTTTKTVVAQQVEELPLTAALEALIENERQEADGSYPSDSESLPKEPRLNGNAGELPTPASSYYLYESPVGSPKDEIEYPPSNPAEEGAAWRLAWGWGGLPKISRRSKQLKTPEYASVETPSTSRPGTPGGPAVSIPVAPASPHPVSDIMSAPPTPPLATPSKRSDLALSDDSSIRGSKELNREAGSSWTRSIIRYFKPGDAKPGSMSNLETEKSKKKMKEENITVDGGVFMMDTVTNIRSSSGTASELTDTNGDSDSDSDEEEEEEEREFVDAQSELPLNTSTGVRMSEEFTNGDLDVPSSPEVDTFSTPLLALDKTANFPSDAVAVAILDPPIVSPEEEKRRKRVIERHGSISYETTLLVGDSEEDSMPIPVTVTAPLKMSSPTTVQETQITILPDDKPKSSSGSNTPIISTPPMYSLASIAEESSDSSPVISSLPAPLSSPSPPPSDPITLSPTISSAPPSEPTKHSSAPPSLSSSMVDLPLPPVTRPLLSSPSLNSANIAAVSAALDSNFRPPSPSAATLRSSAPSMPTNTKLPSPANSPPRPSTPIQEEIPEREKEIKKEEPEKTEKEEKKDDKTKDKVAVMNPLEVGNFKVEISLCASQLAGLANNKELIDATFAKFKVSYDDFCSNSALLTNQDLVFKFNDRLYPWSIAAPYLMSVLIFHQPLKPSALEALTKSQEKSKRSSWGYFWPFRSQSKATLTTDPEASGASTKPVSPPRIDTQKIQELKKELQEQLPPQGESPAPHSDDSDSDDKPRKYYSKKTLRPTAEQLKSLGLQPGANVITFSVTSTLQGTREVSARIFLWDINAKIIVSDIDGTITKSDVYGQIAPILGRDWTHVGVAQLYSNISKNGYRIIYLTSRAIGQAGLTRGFITSVKHVGEAGVGLFLPEGPIMLSPNRLLASINREVIRRNPEEFKIACLKDIKALFPPGHTNFYAGFGNRITDAVAYTAVGIPRGRVFTINPMGVIININNTYKKSYTKLNEVVWEMFPPLHLGSNRAHLDEKYNDFNYWKHQSGTQKMEFDF